jgi:hypothetical protein
VVPAVGDESIYVDAIPTVCCSSLSFLLAYLKTVGRDF